MLVMLMHDEASKASLPHPQCACYMRTSALVTPKNPPDSDHHQLLRSIVNILYSIGQTDTGYWTPAHPTAPISLLITQNM